MIPWTDEDLQLYQSQFERAAQLVGHAIHSTHFYLEPTDTDFTEQPNAFGKPCNTGSCSVAELKPLKRHRPTHRPLSLHDWQSLHGRPLRS